jgi:glucose/arabinose dehydrogenase
MRIGGVVLILVVAAGGCTTNRAESSVPPGVAEHCPTNRPQARPPAIVAGLCAPWGLAFLPDGTALVTERDTARILSVTRAGTVTELQRLAEPRRRGEGGLLGIAVAPTYASDKWVYVYYTTDTDNRIARLHIGQPAQPILTGIPAAEFHNGGRIAFGPDGLLYAGTGDAGRRSLAPDPGYLGGKILRVTPDGRPAPGNPFGDSPVWSVGHRNVQGLAWDARGRLYASEFGQDTYDELNIIERGRDYGWPVVEGTATVRRFVNPVATWTPTREASPSGIAVVGDQVYLACLAGRRLYRVGLGGGRAEALLAGDYGRLRHVAPAPDGSLWILTSNREGRGEPAAQDDRIVRLRP